MKKLLILLLSLFVLSACGLSYKVDVDLTSEDVQALQVKIEEYKVAISEFNEEEAIYNFPKSETIGLASAYQELGELGKAIDVYKDILDSGINNTVMIHNLGRLYERANEYELAIEQYQRLIDEYNNNQYLKDITWAYIRMAERATGDQALEHRKAAEKYFNAWQLEFNKTDEHIQQTIKDLREKEKEA